MPGVLVIGPHRCGTSCVAGVIERLGVDMGRPEGGWPTYDSNPEGQYEDPTLVTLLDRTYGNWRTANRNREHNLPLLDVAAYTRLRDNMSMGLWGFKDPKLCFGGVHVLNQMQNPKVVFVVRNPLDAAQSIAAREPAILPTYISMRIVSEYWLGMMDVLSWCYEKKIPAMVMSYERVLDNTEECVEAIAEHLGVPSTPEAIAFVNPDLRHWDSNGS